MNEPLSALAKQAVLRSRAQALAAEARTEAEAPPALDVVVIRVADEMYAVDSEHVREVLALKDVTPLPCTPAFVLGLANVRGQILSVIDLRVLFDLPREAGIAPSKVIVLRAGEMEVGLAADALIEARSVPLDEIRPVPGGALTALREACTRGIVGGAVAVLDVARLLAEPSIVVDEQVEGGER